MGDNYYQQSVEKHIRDLKPRPNKDYLNQIYQGEYEDRIEENDLMCYEQKTLEIKNQLDRLKSNPPRIIRDDLSFTLVNQVQKPLVTFKEQDEPYRYLFRKPFKDFGTITPYVLVDLDKLSTVKALMIVK